MGEYGWEDREDREDREAEFWTVTRDLAHEQAEEQRAVASSILAAARDTQTFADALRRLAPGDLVTIATVDGAALSGRVLGVGLDFVTLGEVGDGTGAARAHLLRTHDVRLDAVVRVAREPDR